MTNQSTIDKLIEMRLTTMADAFRSQLNDPNWLGRLPPLSWVQCDRFYHIIKPISTRINFSI